MTIIRRAWSFHPILVAATLLSGALVLPKATEAQAHSPEEPSTAAVEPSASVDEQPGSALDLSSEQALQLNVELMDEVLREATKETVRVQKIAAITGITIGTALLGLGTWRLVETNPQNAFSRGVGVGWRINLIGFFTVFI